MHEAAFAAIARQANQTLADAGAEDILTWAHDTFAPQIALSCSFGGPGGIILAHMSWRLKLPTTILFADTGFLFPETVSLKARLEAQWGLTIRTVTPRLTPREQAAAYGDALWATDPDRCCALRKVAPMAEALDEYRCWVTGLRRNQSAARRSTDKVECHTLANGHALVKVNPLADWDRQTLWDYINEHQLPYNPLLDVGYRSIGCVQCTARTADDDERSGRWAGTDKTECGLHTFTARQGNG